jgi:hypothetical protein
MLVVRQRAPGKKYFDLPFPFIILDIHLIVRLIFLAAAPNMEQKNRLGMKIRFTWLGGRRREAQDELEID